MYPPGTSAQLPQRVIADSTFERASAAIVRVRNRREVVSTSLQTGVL
jgi:hypothetical protein